MSHPLPLHMNESRTIHECVAHRETLLQPELNESPTTHDRVNFFLSFFLSFFLGWRTPNLITELNG